MMSRFVQNTSTWIFIVSARLTETTFRGRHVPPLGHNIPTFEPTNLCSYSLIRRSSKYQFYKSLIYGFHSFPVVDRFCLFIYLWVWLFLWKIVRSSVILLLPLFDPDRGSNPRPTTKYQRKTQYTRRTQLKFKMKNSIQNYVPLIYHICDINHILLRFTCQCTWFLQVKPGNSILDPTGA
jgi:hypothetical protein